MKVNKDIFKSYDIRGIYPGELNEETAEQIGRAFVKYAKAKNIIVGRDGRLSSESLFNSLVKGITEQGADVYDIGQAPTEGLYFAVGEYNYDAGTMITASHNPASYNGFKMLQKKGKDIFVIRGKDMLEAIKGDSFSQLSKRKLEGKVKELDIWHDYLNHIFSFVDISGIKPFKVVMDSGNGMAGKVIPLLKQRLPIEIISLNLEIDGNFPNRPPNPLLEGAGQGIREKILEQAADFGFMFDGDGDRIFLVDEQGQLVRADIVLLFLAKELLEKNPGSAVSYNAICSKAVPEFIKKWGGKPVRTQVGFVNVREGIIENNGVMGGELSGHYCFRDNFYLDSGFIAFLILLEVFSKDKRKVSQMVSELSLYAKSSEINFETENKEAVLNKIKEKYFDGKQDYLDGITVEYDEWWFNVRSSQTEPLLRLTIEADTKELLEKKKKELTDFIKKQPL